MSTSVYVFIDRETKEIVPFTNNPAWTSLGAARAYWLSNWTDLTGDYAIAAMTIFGIQKFFPLVELRGESVGTCSKPDDFDGNQANWEAHCAYTDSLCQPPRLSGSTKPKFDAYWEKIPMQKGDISEHD